MGQKIFSKIEKIGKPVIASIEGLVLGGGLELLLVCDFKIASENSEFGFPEIKLGLIPAVILFSGMYLIGFFVSHYLNQITPSSHRATVLSFKGLAFNLFYGLMGVLYSSLLAWQKPRTAAIHTQADPQQLEGLVFIQSFQWFPWTFLVGLILFLIFARFKLKSTRVHREVAATQEQPGG